MDDERPKRWDDMDDGELAQALLAHAQRGHLYRSSVPALVMGRKSHTSFGGTDGSRRLVDPERDNEDGRLGERLVADWRSFRLFSRYRILYIPRAEFAAWKRSIGEEVEVVPDAPR